MSATVAILLGLAAILGAACLLLIRRARRAGNQRHKPSRGRASRPTPMSGLLPSLRHPLAVDATASEFDDVRRPGFMPVSLLTEPNEREERASAKIL